VKAERMNFSNQEIVLDGREFRLCHFDNCMMKYGATRPVTLDGCSFNNVRWEFVGAASDTVQFMSALYHGAGEGGIKLIEQTFENIKRGVHRNLD
jgi:hypothetical protein